MVAVVVAGALVVAGVVVAVVGDTTLVEGMTVVGTDVLEPTDGACVVVGLVAVVDEHAPSPTTPTSATDAIAALTRRLINGPPPLKRSAARGADGGTIPHLSPAARRSERFCWQAGIVADDWEAKASRQR